MDRRVEGTFRDQKSVRDEISRLLNEESYEAGEILVLSDNQNEVYAGEFNNVGVRFVDAATSADSDSFWERLKEAFTFERGDEDETDENPLERYGVSHELSQHYLDVLQDGEYVLLVDQSAPRNKTGFGTNTGAGETNKTDAVTIKGAERTMAKDEAVDKESKKEAEAIKSNSSEEKRDEAIEISEEEPELTGEETTVEKTTSKEKPEEENKGEKEIKDPLRGKHVDRPNDPSPDEEHAEEDEIYSEEAEDAGLQSDEE